MPVDLSRTSGGKQTRDTWQSTSGALVRRYQRAFAKAATLQPIHRLDSVVDRKRDRFLTELGARIRTEAAPRGLPFSHNAASLAAAEVWNLVCADGEFGISFHPSGFAGGYAELALNAHRLRVGQVEVVVADSGPPRGRR